jgi:ERF superfamily
MVEGKQSNQIYGLMSSVMQEIKAVPKDGMNRQQGFAYRSIEATIEAVHRALTKFQVIVLPEVIESEHEVVHVGAKQTAMRRVRIRVAYTYMAPDGSMVMTVSEGEGMDSGDKATSKALSMCFKYALFQTFAIPTGDPDPDGATFTLQATLPQLSDETKGEIKSLAEERNITGADLAALMGEHLKRKVTGYHDLSEEDGVSILKTLQLAIQEKA